MGELKKLISVLSTGVLSVGLVACGNGEDNSEAGQSDASQDSDSLSGEVTLWTASLAGEPFDSYFENIKDEFEDMHPDVEVIIEDTPQDEISQRVLTSLTGSADDVPDVVNLAPRYMVNIASQGGLLDLTELISDETKNSFLEGAFDSGYFDDSLYALPWYLTTTVSWYNNDHFEQAGVSEAPQSMQDIYDTAEAITEQTGQPSFFQIINEGDTVMEKMLTLADGEPIVVDGETVIADHEEIVEFFELTQQMYEEGLMPQENAEGTFTTAQELYMAGNLSFLESGVTFLGPVESGAPSIYEVSQAGEPLNDPEARMNVAVMNFSVPANSQNPDAAVALMEFVTNAENQLEFAKIAGTVLPSTEESLEDDFFQDAEDSPKASGMLEATNTLQRAEVLIPPLENSARLHEITKMAFVQNLQGDLSPDEALQQITEQWNDSFEEADITPTF